MKVLKHPHEVLVYWHLCGYINLSYYIDTYPVHSLTINKMPLGYGIYYIDDIEDSAGIIKNDIMYTLSYTARSIIEFYHYLVDNEYIKSLGLKVNYERDGDDSYKIKWTDKLEVYNDSLYFIYDKAYNPITLFD